MNFNQPEVEFNLAFMNLAYTLVHRKSNLSLELLTGCFSTGKAQGILETVLETVWHDI